jgi:hypothetical protein
MLNAPDGVNLLTIARETLLKTILPGLPEEKLYPILMIANAMAVAAREAAHREEVRDAELADLEEFYGDTAAPAGNPDERLVSLNRRLARDARAGRFHGVAETRFRAVLERQVRARLRVSNPKYLAGPA